MKYLVKTMSILRREDKILAQFHVSLANKEIAPTASPEEDANELMEDSSPLSDEALNYKMAAHDLLSPLAIQYSMLYGLKAKLEEALKQIHSLSISNYKSIKISRAALTTRGQAIKPISFKKIFNAVTQLLGIEEFHKDVEMVIHINSCKPFFSNVVILQSILQNLIQNSLKYKQKDQQNTIAISVGDTDKGVEIIIEDTGVGIDPARLQTLFTTKVKKDSSVEDSHGFGLYGIAQYVHKLNGTISAQSEVNVGSIFIVNIPNTKQ